MAEAVEGRADQLADDTSSGPFVSLRAAEVPALLRDVRPVTARRNAVSRRVTFRQLDREAEGRPARTLDEQALAVGVAPAAPDRSGRDQVEAHERLLDAV